MDFTVDLQPTLGFSWYYIPAAIVLIAAGILLVVLGSKKLKRAIRERKSETEGKKKLPLPQLIALYDAKVSEIEQDLETGKIDVRGAYLALSAAVREFVYEATDIHVREFTLTEIENANLPELADLIHDFYEPEFALRSRTDTVKTIAKTRRLIRGWN